MTDQAIASTSQPGLVSKPIVKAARSDRLTAGRLMLITAGIAVGLTLFLPAPEKSFDDGENFRFFLNSVLCGASLPGLWFVLTRRYRRERIGAGGWMALAAGLGVLLMLPPAAVNRFKGPGPSDVALVCLHYTMPLTMLWLLLAVVVAGLISWRDLWRQSEWSERYGILLAIAWFPLGVWILVMLYHDSLFS